MTLRLRLSLAVVGLVCVALLVADAATFFSLQSYLIKRVDQQLRLAQFPVSHALADTGASFGQGMPQPPGGGDAMLPPGTYGELLDQSGKTLNEVAFTYGGSTPAAPSLPADLVQHLATAQQQFLTVAGSGSSTPMANPSSSRPWPTAAAGPRTSASTSAPPSNPIRCAANTKRSSRPSPTRSRAGNSTSGASKATPNI